MDCNNLRSLRLFLLIQPFSLQHIMPRKLLPDLSFISYMTLADIYTYEVGMSLSMKQGNFVKVNDFF